MRPMPADQINRMICIFLRQETQGNPPGNRKKSSWIFFCILIGKFNPKYSIFVRIICKMLLQKGKKNVPNINQKLTIKWRIMRIQENTWFAFSTQVIPGALNAFHRQIVRIGKMRKMETARHRQRRSNCMQNVHKYHKKQWIKPGKTGGR